MLSAHAATLHTCVTHMSVRRGGCTPLLVHCSPALNLYSLSPAPLLSWYVVFVAAILSLDTSPFLPPDPGSPDIPSHCTLLYLGDPTPELLLPLASLASLLSEASPLLAAAPYPRPLVAHPGGHAVFDTPDGFAAVALLDAPWLPLLRSVLEYAALEAGVPAASQHGFVPHATLRYFDYAAAKHARDIRGGGAVLDIALPRCEEQHAAAHDFLKTAPSLPGPVPFTHFQMRVNGIATAYAL